MNKQIIIQSIEDALNSKVSFFEANNGITVALSTQDAEHPAKLVQIDRVITALETQDEFCEGKGFLINSIDGGGQGFNSYQASTILISLAHQTNSPSGAVDWLEKILTTQEATAFHITALWSLPAKKITNLYENIDLVAFDDLPDSRQKQSIQGVCNYQPINLLSPPPNLALPQSALVFHGTVTPFKTPITRDTQIQPIGPVVDYSLLNDVRLALVVVGPRAYIEAIRWGHFEDNDLEYALIGSGSSRLPPELFPRSFFEYGPFDSTKAKAAVHGFLRLKGKSKNKVRIALDRLNRAMCRADAGDQATELGIALDTLFTDQHVELSYKIALRSALLLGGKISVKKSHRAIIQAIYDIRSSMVHNGSVSKTMKVQGRGKLPLKEIVKEGIIITSAIISRIIELGGIPKWNTVELSGRFKKGMPVS